MLAKGFRFNYYGNRSFEYFKKENEMISLESICVDLYILKRSYMTGRFHQYGSTLAVLGEARVSDP